MTSTFDPLIAPDAFYRLTAAQKEEGRQWARGVAQEVMADWTEEDRALGLSYTGATTDFRRTSGVSRGYVWLVSVEGAGKYAFSTKTFPVLKAGDVNRRRLEDALRIAVERDKESARRRDTLQRNKEIVDEVFPDGIPDGVGLMDLHARAGWTSVYIRFGRVTFGRLGGTGTSRPIRAVPALAAAVEKAAEEIDEVDAKLLEEFGV